MPTANKGSFQKSGQSKLRARYHDMNSTRRHRGKGTVTWENYQKRTNNGRTEYTNKSSKK